MKFLLILVVAGNLGLSGVTKPTTTTVQFDTMAACDAQREIILQAFRRRDIFRVEAMCIQHSI